MTAIVIPIKIINPIMKRILKSSSYIGALILASAGSKFTLKPIQKDIAKTREIMSIK